MFRMTLHLSPESVVMHSSNKSWVSAGRVEYHQHTEFSAVRTAESRSERVAAKLSQEKETLWREFMTLRSLGCSAAAQSVIAVTSFFEPDFVHGLDHYGVCCSGGYYALALEKGAYDLGQYLREGRLEDEEARHGLVRQLCDIVAAINDAGYVWNDVKPGNFVFVSHENKWKAIDVESADVVGSPLQGSSCVTIRYAAPEIARACRDRNLHRLRSNVLMDAWSLGMTLLCVFTEHGGNYFETQNVGRSADIIRHLTSDKCERFIERYIDKRLRDQAYATEKQAIRDLLRVNEQSRRSASEVLEQLQRGASSQQVS